MILYFLIIILLISHIVTIIYLTKKNQKQQNQIKEDYLKELERLQNLQNEKINNLLNEHEKKISKLNTVQENCEAQYNKTIRENNQIIEIKEKELNQLKEEKGALEEKFKNMETELNDQKTDLELIPVMSYFIKHAKESLPLSMKQLKLSVSKIEKNTNDAIESFANLLTNFDNYLDGTKKVVNSIKKKSISNISNSDISFEQEDDIKVIEKNYKEILEKILKELSITYTRKNDDIRELDRIGEKVKEIVPLSQEISTISMTTKILALNAEIEAAKAGKHGKTFGVIADEVRKLAQNSSSSAETIQNGLDSASAFIDEEIEKLKEAMDVETRFINSTIVLLKDLFLTFIDYFVELSVSMDQSLGKSSAMKDDIQAIIINLQFEDITKQISQHVLESMKNIINQSTQFDDLFGDNPEHLEIKNKILEDFKSRSTMEEERNVIDKPQSSPKIDIPPDTNEMENESTGLEEVIWLDDETEMDSITDNQSEEVEDDSVTFF